MGDMEVTLAVTFSHHISACPLHRVYIGDLLTLEFLDGLDGIAIHQYYADNIASHVIYTLQ